MSGVAGGDDQAAAVVVGSSQFAVAMTSRWPREETLALIKIRSEMDVAFRDSCAKGPLWEEVSRKLAALGYGHRSGKKCREKFENVYKYHKRTKEGRTGAAAAAAASPMPGVKSKTYRFFDQLEALEPSPPAGASSLVSLPQPLPTVVQQFPFPGTVYSAPPNAQQQLNNFSVPTVLPVENPSYLPGVVSADSTSSSTYSDKDLRGGGEDEREEKSEKSKRWRRKRKKSEWIEMFERLIGEVARKQEELQKNLFDVIERRERERLAREEAWRAQEAARIDRECEMLARDRSAAAAKDNAVMAFLQSIAEQQQKSSVPREKSRDGDNNLAGTGRNLSPLQQTLMKFSAPLPLAVKGTTKPVGAEMMNAVELEKVEVNGEKNSGGSSRWPRAEVEALIKLRTNSHANYGENATKGPLWEEISSAMKKLGYNRNPKRCKEKWENINKYFKKVKESNKKRKEDSKTCPYFDLLDEIYSQKIGKNNNTDGNFFLSFRSPDGNDNNNNGCSLSAATPHLMVAPVQQWPPPAPPHPTSGQDFGGGGDSEGEFDDEDDDEDDREGCREEQFLVAASKV